MPGVLVESPLPPPPPDLYPFESSSFSNACFHSNGGGFGPTNLAPVSPNSSPPHLPHLDALCSSPPSSSHRARERFLPKSNLGLPYFAEPTGMPISSPVKSLHHHSSADSMAGSLPFSDRNYGVGSPPVLLHAFSSLHKFLPSNVNDDESWPADVIPAMDAYSCDDFRMYEFKVRRCLRVRSHDWTECPFAHHGEKARRRDPRCIPYSGTVCPDFRKGGCRKGDSCEYAHGVFECWLHPGRYRTQPCKDGRACRRRVCFFAHTVEQLRVPPSASVVLSTTSNTDMGGLRHVAAENSINSVASKAYFLQKAMENQGVGYDAPSPTLTLPSYHADSPPLSPSSPPMSHDMCLSRNMFPQEHMIPGHRRHLHRFHTMPTISIPSNASDFGVDASKFEEMECDSPASVAQMHSPPGAGVSELFHSLRALRLSSSIAELQRSASTPSSPESLKLAPTRRTPLRQCLYHSIPGSPTSPSLWDLSVYSSIDVDPLQRVESGRNLRAEVYGKIGKENGVEGNEDPDLGWVSELVK